MLKVRVSDRYHGIGWYDPKARMNFMKSDGVITVPDGTNTYNINRNITLNSLEVVEDPKPIVVEETIVRTTPGQLLSNNNADKVTETEVVEETVEVKATEVETAVEETVEVHEEIKDEKVACQYCGKKYSQKGLGSHEKSCKKNPENK